MNHQLEGACGLSFGTDIGDLEWPLTAK